MSNSNGGYNFIDLTFGGGSGNISEEQLLALDEVNIINKSDEDITIDDFKNENGEIVYQFVKNEQTGNIFYLMGSEIVKVVNLSALDRYVTLDTEQEITAKKNFKDKLSIGVSFDNLDYSKAEILNNLVVKGEDGKENNVNHITLDSNIFNNTLFFKGMTVIGFEVGGHYPTVYVTSYADGDEINFYTNKLSYRGNEVDNSRNMFIADDISLFGDYGFLTIYVDTTDGEVTVTLPESKYTNWLVRIIDINGTFSQNNCIVKIHPNKTSDEVFFNTDGLSEYRLDVSYGKFDVQYAGYNFRIQKHTWLVF